MMDLVLRKNVEEKTMNSPFILGMTFKKYLALKEKVDYLWERQTIQQLDSLI